MSLYLIILLLYAFLLVAIGGWTSRSIRGAGDFFVAGRRLSPGLLFATLLAANIGAGSTIGATGLGHRYGLSAWWWVGSAGIGSLILGLTVGPRIWGAAARTGFYTVGDYLEHRYSRGVRGLIAVLLWFGTLAILAGQLIAVSEILEIVIGVSRYAGCLLGGLVIIFYFTLGGLPASARVNAVQLIVISTGFLLTLGFIVGAPGGPGHALSSPASGPSSGGPAFQSFLGDDPGRILGYIVILVPAFIISPGLLQKIYGARDAGTVRWSVCCNGVALMLFAFIPALLGMAAHTEFPDLANPEHALPALLTRRLPVWLGGLTLAAVFSAEISSADAVLFMLTTSLSRDLYHTFIHPDASEARLLAVARLTSLAAGVLGVLLAALLPSVITALSIFYSILSVALFVPLTAGLYSRRPDAASAYRTIFGAILTMTLMHVATDGRGVSGVPPPAWGMAAAVVIMMLSVGRKGKEEG